MQEVARGIGADVPFFLFGGVAYLAGGGDELQERFPRLGGVPAVVVRAPGAGVPTPAAYAEFDRLQPAAGELEPMRAALRAGDTCVALARMSNNLWPVAARLCPSCAEVHTWLRAQEGAWGTMLCGSGSAVFAACESVSAADRIAAAAKACGWWATATELV